LYHTLICFTSSTLFCDVAKGLQYDSEGNYLTSFDGWANLAWASVYLVPPIAFLVSVVMNCVCLGVIFVCAFLFVIFACLLYPSVRKRFLAFICALLSFLFPHSGGSLFPSFKLGLNDFLYKKG